MKMTEALKSWLVKNCEVDKDSTDDELKAAAAEALVEGTLTAEKYTELTKDPDEDRAGLFSKQFDTLTKGIEKLTEILTQGNKGEEKKEEEKKEEKALEGGKEEKEKKPDGQKAEPSAMAKMIGRLGGTPVELDGKAIDVRVKEAAEQYNTTKTVALYPAQTKQGKSHPFAGQPIMDFSEKGKALDVPSDLDCAISGAYAKFLCAAKQRGGSKTFGFQALPDHDRELLLYAMECMKWNGASNSMIAESGMADIVERKLSPSEQKALIDDATSGGLEAAPIVFDDQVIQVPLLHGELFPLVNTVPLDRGRRVEGVATGTVTSSWGGVDDTAITLFDTTSYVSAFDTTIFRWEGSIRIGLDFLSDTPIDFGRHVTSQYGERLLEDLDDVVATGDGTTQPEGVMSKSGTTSVAFGGSTSIGNYESLRFSVAKNEHRPNVKNTAVFCGTETSYQRVRAIPVGASDARRIFGHDYSSYRVMEHDYKINESLTNAQIFYAILARYRMYRRRGLVMRTSTEGDTLIRNNEMLMVALARYGGQLERGAVAGVTTTAPA